MASYDIFRSYGLHKIHDSLTENFDYKDNDASRWELVDVKNVPDSDGFMTEYAWYTDGEKHIFMFGDTDITDPDEDYADWEAESQEVAKEWFDSYKGFSEEEDSYDFDEELDNEPSGNANFMNDGFNRAYNIEGDLED